MPTPLPRLRPLLAILIPSSIFMGFAAPPASAQSVGWPASYSLRWYGQNFYDHQHNPLRDRNGYHRQYNSGYYGPPMLYTRQYGDQVGNVRDLPHAPRDRGYWNGFHQGR